MLESSLCSSPSAVLSSDTTKPTLPSRKQSPSFIAYGKQVLFLSPNTRQVPECRENTSGEGMAHHPSLYVMSNLCARESPSDISVGANIARPHEARAFVGGQKGWMGEMVIGVVNLVFV